MIFKFSLVLLKFEEGRGILRISRILRVSEEVEHLFQTLARRFLLRIGITGSLPVELQSGSLQVVGACSF